MKLNSQIRPILPNVSSNNNSGVSPNLSSLVSKASCISGCSFQSSCVPSQCGMFTNNLGVRPRLNNLV